MDTNGAVKSSCHRVCVCVCGCVGRGWTKGLYITSAGV